MATIAPPARALMTGAGSRLAWLDALRGFAAMLVVYEHLTHHFFNPMRLAIERWFLAGYAGVCLFFVVSGYIIPASLERKGDLRSFWIGRAFRLYPLYLAILAIALVLHFAGLRPFDPAAVAKPGTTAIAHATMMSTLLAVPDVLGVTWTLAFEMTFYLLVASFHTARIGRASPYIALGLAALSFVTTPLPVERLSGSGRGLLVAVAVTVVVFGAIAAMSSRARAIVGGAVAAVGVSALLLGWNQNGAHTSDGLLIPALMFTGTTLHRAEHRQIHRAWAIVVPVVVVGVWCAQVHRDVAPLFPAMSVTLPFILLLFALGWLLRHRPIPRALSWLGLVSYSLYLIHRVVFDAVLPPGPSERTLPVQAVLAVGLVLAILAASAITYRFVELPAQQLGRTVARRTTSEGSEATRGRPG